MAVYYPPVRTSNEPGASLDDHPCKSARCLSQHELLATLVYLMATYTSAGTADEIENATRRFRLMSPTDQLRYLIEQFSDALIDGADSEAIKCYKCYSDQKLQEMYTYLSGLMFAV